jgi:hypothetical protein
LLVSDARQHSPASSNLISAAVLELMKPGVAISGFFFLEHREREYVVGRSARHFHPSLVRFGPPFWQLRMRWTGSPGWPPKAPGLLVRMSMR